MFTLRPAVKSLGLASVLTAAALSFSGLAQAFPFDFETGIPAGWTCTGNCGTLGAHGVVTASPAGGKYGYIVSNTGITGLGLGLGLEDDGSRLRSGVFSAGVGDELEFYFNYVTTDGEDIFDYAWARLLDTALNQVALLFTARTTPSGNTVPGFGMPLLPSGVTLTPATKAIIPGAPTWSPLVGFSGECFGDGCGYTHWIKMNYLFAAAGDYILEFGVVDWNDEAYDSGLAFDGGVLRRAPPPPPPPPGAVPEPATLALLGLGLLGLGLMRRRA